MDGRGGGYQGGEVSPRTAGLFPPFESAVNIEQASNDNWNQQQIPFPLCTVDLTASAFSTRYGIQFFEFEDDGLGTCQCALVLIKGRLCMLECHPKGPAGAELVT